MSSVLQICPAHAILMRFIKIDFLNGKIDLNKLNLSYNFYNIKTGSHFSVYKEASSMLNTFTKLVILILVIYMLC